MKRILTLILPCCLLLACGTGTGPGDGTSGTTGAGPSSDGMPPVFAAGGMNAESVTATALFVTWPGAVDAVTGGFLLEYRLYYSPTNSLATVQAVTNGGIPAMAWTCNIREWLVTGLAPSNTYQFAVLVRDQAGNLALQGAAGTTTGLDAGVVRTVVVAGQAVRVRHCPGGLSPVQSDTVLSNVAPFWIGETEVTYGLWHAVYTWATNNGYVFAYPGQEGSAGTPGAAPSAVSNQPVVNMCWRDVVVWCNAASELAGLSPVYLSNASGPVVRRSTSQVIHVNGLDNAHVVPAGSGFRFTTREEWYCAARYHDGISWIPSSGVPGLWGTPGTAATNYAWYSANAGGATHEAGLLLPNVLGCHDLSGNAEEFFFSTAAYWEKQSGSCPFYDSWVQLGTYYGRHSYAQYVRTGFRLALTAQP